METTALLVVTIIFALIIKKFFDTKRQWSRLPPGPYGVPILGYIPYLVNDGPAHLMEMAKKYGNIFSIRLGLDDTVVINSWRAVKEALGHDAILARPVVGIFDACRDHTDKSMIETSGKLWREERRFALSALRDLGFGKNDMETKIKHEIHEFMEVIDGFVGKTVDLRDHLMSSVSNTISEFVVGHGLQRGDRQRSQLDKAITFFARDLNIIGIMTTFPSLARLMIKLSLFKFDILQKSMDDMMEFISAEVDLHKKKSADGSDYIDLALNNGLSNEMTVKENARLLFLAGSETTTTALIWCFLILAGHEDVQQSLADEIDMVIGRDASPSWSHRLQMPLIQSFIMEVLRWRPIVPINVPRRAETDVTIDGVLIPAGITVVANLWAVSRDETIWKNADTFDARRFLDENNHLVRNEALITFSYGKRACPGEVMAQYELFLYLTMMLQKFVIRPQIGGKVTYGYKVGGTLQATDPFVTFQCRQ